MKNLSKNFFLGLTLVCIVALGVFLIQLIIINSGTEPVEPDSVISGLQKGPDGDGQSGEDGQPEDDNPFGDGYTPPPTVRPPPQGERREIAVDTIGTRLIVYAESEKFDYAENEFDWRFEYRGSGSAALEISHVFVSSEGIGTVAEDFLNRKTGGSNADYKGQQPIIDSPMNGYLVQANSGGVSYEAWLCRLPESELALAFLINYEFDSQRDDLYTVLSSMSMLTSEG